MVKKFETQALGAVEKKPPAEQLQTPPEKPGMENVLDSLPQRKLTADFGTAIETPDVELEKSTADFVSLKDSSDIELEKATVDFDPELEKSTGDFQPSAAASEFVLPVIEKKLSPDEMILKDAENSYDFFADQWGQDTAEYQSQEAEFSTKLNGELDDIAQTLDRIRQKGVSSADEPKELQAKLNQSLQELDTFSADLNHKYDILSSINAEYQKTLAGTVEEGGKGGMVGKLQAYAFHEYEDLQKLLDAYHGLKSKNESFKSNLNVNSQKLRNRIGELRANVEAIEVNSLPELDDLALDKLFDKFDVVPEEKQRGIREGLSSGSEVDSEMANKVFEDPIYQEAWEKDDRLVQKLSSPAAYNYLDSVVSKLRLNKNLNQPLPEDLQGFLQKNKLTAESLSNILDNFLYNSAADENSYAARYNWGKNLAINAEKQLTDKESVRYRLADDHELRLLDDLYEESRMVQI